MARLLLLTLTAAFLLGLAAAVNTAGSTAQPAALNATTAQPSTAQPSTAQPALNASSAARAVNATATAQPVNGSTAQPAALNATTAQPSTAQPANVSSAAQPVNATGSTAQPANVSSAAQPVNATGSTAQPATNASSTASTLAATPASAPVSSTPALATTDIPVVMRGRPVFGKGTRVMVGGAVYYTNPTTVPKVEELRVIVESDVHLACCADPSKKVVWLKYELNNCRQVTAAAGYKGCGDVREDGHCNVDDNVVCPVKVVRHNKSGADCGMILRRAQLEESGMYAAFYKDSVSPPALSVVILKVEFFSWEQLFFGIMVGLLGGAAAMCILLTPFMIVVAVVHCLTDKPHLCDKCWVCWLVKEWSECFAATVAAVETVEVKVEPPKRWPSVEFSGPQVWGGQSDDEAPLIEAPKGKDEDAGSMDSALGGDGGDEEPVYEEIDNPWGSSLYEEV